MAPNPLQSSSLVMPPSSFRQKKSKILAALAVPLQDYDDLSPKGSIDEGIRPLIDEINCEEGWVTTSSCAGRVSVFVEGEKRARTAVEEVAEEAEKLAHVREGEGEEVHANATRKKAGSGGKGGGGKWLFVSHEPVLIHTPDDDVMQLLDLRMEAPAMSMDERSLSEQRLIHFKFEPMILHILTASLHHAQIILTAALQAGFRESGALNLISDNTDGATPIVAVRSTGLALDSIIGRLGYDGTATCVVSRNYVEGLIAIANERFRENSTRITRFRELLLASSRSGKKGKGEDWEDAAVRRERKREEGLRRSEHLRAQSADNRLL